MAQHGVIIRWVHFEDCRPACLPASQPTSQLGSLIVATNLLLAVHSHCCCSSSVFLRLPGSRSYSLVG